MQHHKLYKSNPSFCYIAPTSYLAPLEHLLSQTHLVLAHLVATDEEYAAFYHKRSSLGDLIIMDNSAYELKEPYHPDQLVDLAGKCGAHYCVLPDYPFQPGKVTVDAAKEFIPAFKNAGLGTMFVPQSERGQVEDWITTYRWAGDNPDIDIIGMSILGIPNALIDINPAFARVVMSSMLKDRGVFTTKHHHYLGLNSGPKLEIPSLIRMKALNTIDSSGPIWSAILGHHYTSQADSFMMTSKSRLPVNFDLPFTKDAQTVDLLVHNITMTKSLFNPSIGSENVWYANE